MIKRLVLDDLFTRQAQADNASWEHSEKSGSQTAVPVEWPDRSRRDVAHATDARFKSVPRDLKNEQLGFRGKPTGIWQHWIKQRHVTLLHGSTRGRGARRVVCDQETRTYSGRPRSSMQLSTCTAMATSVD
jgi:hypothetical protein